MSVEIINPLDYTGWEDLLDTHENSSFFHTSHWAGVLGETYGYQPLYFTEITQGNLQLLIPVMEIKSCLTGKRGVSLPFTDYCEPILSPRANENGVWNTLVDYGENARWKYIEIRGGDRFGQSTRPSSWYYDHILDLSADPQEVYDSFRDSNKRNIQKARKVGVEVVMCESLDSMKVFYRLHCLTRKMHGLPPQPFAFFKHIHEHLIMNKHGLLVMAWFQGKAIASSLYFHFGKKVIYKYGASDSRYLYLRANNLVMWKAIEWYCRNGFEHFSFGRTDPEHEGLKQFKAGWGTRERIINYFTYNLRNKEMQVNKGKVSGGHTIFFRNMPVGILKLIGKVVYRHVG